MLPVPDCLGPVYIVSVCLVSVDPVFGYFVADHVLHGYLVSVHLGQVDLVSGHLVPGGLVSGYFGSGYFVRVWSSHVSLSRV